MVIKMYIYKWVSQAITASKPKQAIIFTSMKQNNSYTEQMRTLDPRSMWFLFARKSL